MLAGTGIAGSLAIPRSVHAAGDWVLHPRGYHHHAAGASRDAVRRSREVDHVMGCFYCHRRVVWEQLEGYDETFLRGQTVDFGDFHISHQAAGHLCWQSALRWHSAG